VTAAGIVLEGGSIEPDGQGTILSTKQCLLSKERNPHLSQTQIEEKLREYLGIEQILWLKDGLKNDHTDGHIDTLARFIDSDRVLAVACEDSAHSNYNATQENIDILRSSKGSKGNAISVIELPLPKNAIEFDGYDLPASYANYYLCNGAVIVPQYGDPNDPVALGILRPLYPDREIIGLSARAIITGGGAFHCITQHQPQGSLWSAK
jgi:agmatine deiminase